jgi:serine/threonine protein kinase
MPEGHQPAALANGRPASRPKAPVVPPPEDLLDAALAEQRRNWLSGKRTPAAEHLRQYPGLAAEPAHAAELVYHEFTLREELGESPDWADYLRQFARYADALRLLRQADELVEQMLPPVDPIRPGPEHVAGYELLEEIGRGGMAVVYKARQRGLDRDVALKMIRAGDCPDEEERRRFRTEAQTVARLRHPNIVQIYEAGESGGQPFLALEFVAGQSLARRLTGTPLPVGEAASLVEVLAQAIDYAHGQGIVHRDLKPANILLQTKEEGGRMKEESIQPASDSSFILHPSSFVPKITDFGLAKRLGTGTNTSTGTVLGTPSYMAPEQAKGLTAAIDRRIDVYGLGAILYELLVGRPPFRADSPLQTLRQVLDAEPARPRLLNPAVPRDLETVCLKCLEKEPARRYPTAAALADDLGRFLSGRPVQARPVGPLGRGRRWCRRNPVPAALAVVLLLSLAAGFAGILREWRLAEAARGEAVASNEAAQQLLTELINSSPIVPMQALYCQGESALDPLLRARSHCEGLLRKNPGDLSLRVALTKVLGCLGTVYYYRGRLSDGEACFRSAHEQWQAAAGEDPRGTECLDWLATTHRWLACSEDDSAQTLASLLEADAIWEYLAEEHPANLDYLQKLTDCRRALTHNLDAQVVRKAWRRPLEEIQAALGGQVGERPADGSLARRLALASLVLGDIYKGEHRQDQATACWQQAYRQYHRLAGTSANCLPVQLALAACCSRLVRGQVESPYYRESVTLFDQTGKALSALLRQDPASAWLRGLLLENDQSLAVCHWKAGQAKQGQYIYNERVRPLVAQLSEPAGDPRYGFQSIGTLLQLAGTLRQANQPGAALALVQETAALASRYSAFPARDLGWWDWLASYFVCISAALNQLEQPAEALHHAEQARRMFEELLRAAPDNLRYAGGLSSAWERIGKARWSLGRAEEALTAFRESAAIQRRLLEMAPVVRLNRLALDKCYARLAHWYGLRGDWPGVAAALRERERLWPGDAEELQAVAQDYNDLAEKVASAPEGCTPEAKEIVRSVIDARKRLLRAAETLATRPTSLTRP